MTMVTLARGTILYILLLSTCCVQCRQKRQFELAPDLPSHLPSPPKTPKDPPPSTNSSSTQGQGDPPPADVPPLIPPSGPLGPGIVPDDFVPFGLNHIILIVVPQFKTKLQKLPEWFASSVIVSMPITVFFDLLTVPPEMLVPGAGGFPFGIPPPLRGPPPPPSPGDLLPPNTVSTPILQSDHSNVGYGYGYYAQKPYLYGNGFDGDPTDSDFYGYGYDDSDDSYYFVEDESSFGERRKREIYANQTVLDTHVELPEIHVPSFYNVRRKRAVNYNRTLHKTERATIIPRLEKILNNAGFEGKSCLLRAVCEVHEAPLQHYGLVGEILTLFFSVSRSIFAESHLPEYARAEEAGKTGDCTEFYEDCENTMFSWENI